MPLVYWIKESNNSNALIDNKTFLNQSIEEMQQVYGNLAEMSRSNDYTSGGLLDFWYH